MPRPNTKSDLIEAANKNFEVLRSILDGSSDEEKHADIFPNERDKNVRDVLVHLSEWHRLLINWIETNMKGVAAPFLPEPYNWRTYPQMCVGFWKKHQNTLYELAAENLKKTHSEAMRLIGTFSEEQLFAKNIFSWTGSTPLGTYCVSAISSHYDWAIKCIKQAIKSFRARN